MTTWRSHLGQTYVTLRFGKSRPGRENAYRRCSGGYGPEFAKSRSKNLERLEGRRPGVVMNSEVEEVGKEQATQG